MMLMSFPRSTLLMVLNLAFALIVGAIGFGVGFAQRLDRFFDHAPIGFAERRVLAQQWLELAGSGDKLLNSRRRDAAHIGDFIHDTLPPA